MKTIIANKVRAKVTEAIMAYFVEAGEDCGMIASNSFNFPICEDGEEGWVEIVVKIPKESEDEDGDGGYAKRDEYVMKCEEKERKAKEKAEKAAKDKAKRKAKEKKEE